MNGNIQIHVHLGTIHYLYYCDVYHCQTLSRRSEISINTDGNWPWVTDITMKYEFWCDLKGCECTNVTQQNKLAE